MKGEERRGSVYVCPVCGAELAIIHHGGGRFAPRCCNVAMERSERILVFYRCPVCGAEVGVVHEGRGDFDPHCCNQCMRRIEEDRP